MGGVVVDTSAWVEFFAGRTVPALEDALAQAAVVLPPLVLAELVSGAHKPEDRAAIYDLISTVPLHETPLGHWIGVGTLRRELMAKGLEVTIPDAHVAQCALELGAALLTCDAVFVQMAQHTKLRVFRV